MAIKTNDIDSYYIRQYCALSWELAASIYCYYRTDHMGTLNFYKDGVTIPAGKLTSDGRIFLNFKEQYFGDIIETLRLEKPLYINIDDRVFWGYLSTSKEPIGEEEA